MPMYDRKCDSCGETKIDLYEGINIPDPFCDKCDGGCLRRAWLGHANHVIADDIPGGIWIDNGICNEDGTPRKYYSKSEMARVAKERGMVNMVRHTTEKGTDKNPHTTRWI